MSVLFIFVQYWIYGRLGDPNEAWTRQRFLQVAIFSLGLPLFLVSMAILPGFDMRGIRLSGKRLVFVAVCFVAASSYIRFQCYGDIGHVEDETGYYYQAYLFSRGELSGVQQQPAESFFLTSLVINQGKQTSYYTYGWPLLLAGGVRMGCPGLVNPVLGGLCVVVLFYIARLMFDERIASLAAAFLATSPLHLFMSATCMSHTSSMLALLLTLYCYVRYRRGGSVVDAVLMGLFFGYAICIRQYTAAVIGLPAALHWIATILRFRGKGGMHFLCCAAGLSVPLFFLLKYNQVISGNWLTFPMYTHPDASALGFGFGSNMGPTHAGHTFLDAVKFTGYRLFLLSTEAFGWPALCLIPSAWYLVSVRKSTEEKLFVASFATLLSGYAIYPWFSAYYGPRFVYECMGLLSLFTARAVFEFQESRFGVRRLPAGMSTACILSSVLFCALLWRLQGADYLNVNSKAIDIVREASLKNAVVFVEEGGWPWPEILYAPFFELNYRQGEVLFVRHLDVETDREVLRLVPNRISYLLSDKGRKGCVLQLYTPSE